MFWSANYIAVRELKLLLKEENVTLTQVLEADDILQECKADNKALIQFLTKPNILAELITLIIEEPPKNVELASQYRHASIACEVLTSHLFTLSDRLSMDTVQMNRLCDFINREPPLNPLLASYFSRTIEMLLERSPKHDWYLYHVVCLRVLDFFKSRRDFLPNLLRHISTSAIADTFKYFIRLDDLFNKIIMEWFEEHQFLECLIQITCGTYVPEPIDAGAGAGADEGAGAERSPEQPEKGQREPSEKHPLQDADQQGEKGSESTEGSERADAGGAGGAGRRTAAVAAANAAALLCDLIMSGCAGEGCNTRPRTSWALVSRLQSADGVRLVLGGMFTAPGAARGSALVHGALVLRALLEHPGEPPARGAVELAAAPHLPLLHQALLRPPAPAALGLPRLHVAALLAALAASEVEEVAATMLTLGTPGVVVEMMFQFPHNNFLHAQAHALLRNALSNKVYRTQYARHLLVECDLLTKLMDAFEENENKTSGAARSAYMGHAILMLRRIARALDEGCATLPPPLAQRWDAFRAHALAAVAHRHDTPLGGYYPSENIYEFIDGTALASLDDAPADIGADAFNEMCSANDTSDYLADEIDLEDVDKNDTSKNNFLELASQRFDDDMWEDSPEADGEGEGEGEGEEEGEGEGEGEGEEGDAAGVADALRRVRELLKQHSPWESSSAKEESSSGGGGGGWAQFDAFAPPAPAPAHAPAPAPPAPPAPAPTAPAPAGERDPFAPPAPAPQDQDNFTAFWPYPSGDGATDNSAQQEIEANIRGLNLNSDLQKMDDASSVELANKLLTAMSGMAPHVLADIVNSVPLPVDPQHSHDQITTHTLHGPNIEENTGQSPEMSSTDNAKLPSEDNQSSEQKSSPQTEGSRAHQEESEESGESNEAAAGDVGAHAAAGVPAREEPQAQEASPAAPESSPCESSDADAS